MYDPIMIARDAEDTIRTLLRGFPVITITGPRQSGKTTLAKSILRTSPMPRWKTPTFASWRMTISALFLSAFPTARILYLIANERIL
jgi:hypothetical protein